MLTPAHIDLYVKMKSDPVTHVGYRVDAALIFCIDGKLFAEFIAGLGELGLTMRQRHGCTDGKRTARPKKMREATA